MAVEQGICKNCGSLVVFNTADETCECIFCNAVFPKAELIAIDAELKDIEFPNEKFEKQTTSNKHQYSVMPDQVAPAVAREKVSNPIVETKNEFEISAKDVKAPKKVIGIVCGITAAVIVAVVGISLPLYFSRTELHDKMQGKMADVCRDFTVDTALDKDGNSAGFAIQGLNSQIVEIATEDKLDETKAKALFDSYSEARKGVGKSGNKDIKMTIFAGDGIYDVTSEGVEFREDSKATASKK